MVRALAAAMMVFTFAENTPPPAAPAPAPGECVRLSGSQIGQLPLVIELAGQTVEFVEWKATDITASELIGFTAQAPTGFHFTVQAGTHQFPASANWLHPAGVVGPQVKAIDALTVCAG